MPYFHEFGMSTDSRASAADLVHEANPGADSPARTTHGQ